jgi:hypothetical protein
MPDRVRCPLCVGYKIVIRLETQEQNFYIYGSTPRWKGNHICPLCDGIGKVPEYVHAAFWLSCPDYGYDIYSALNTPADSEKIKTIKLLEKGEQKLTE